MDDERLIFLVVEQLEWAVSIKLERDKFVSLPSRSLSYTGFGNLSVGVDITTLHFISLII